jgi:hypothetical protein
VLDVRAIATLVSILVAATAAFGQHESHLQLISARSLFQEAADATHLIQNQSERDYAIDEVAKGQALAGFIEQAVSTASESTRQQSVTQKIAEIQVSRRDYDGALRTVSGLPQRLKDAVRVQIGIKQAEDGDTASAMKTADAMEDGYAKDQVLYFVGLEMLRQGDKPGAERVARKITTKAPDVSLKDELESGVGHDWRIPPPVPPSPLETAYSKAVTKLQAGDIQGAVACIEAEKNPADVSADFAQLAKKAAEGGNLKSALLLAEKVHVTGARYEEGYLVGALPSIGKLWAKMNPEEATAWARSRRTAYQRALALTGVAQGVADSKSR